MLFHFLFLWTNTSLYLLSEAIGWVSWEQGDFDLAFRNQDVSWPTKHSVGKQAFICGGRGSTTASVVVKMQFTIYTTVATATFSYALKWKPVSQLYLYLIQSVSFQICLLSICSSRPKGVTSSGQVDYEFGETEKWLWYIGGIKGPIPSFIFMVSGQVLESHLILPISVSASALVSSSATASTHGSCG